LDILEARVYHTLPKLTGYCMVDPDKKKNVNIIKRENGEAMAFVEILIGRIKFSPNGTVWSDQS
jgi:hypothetical protein